jgi:hypothetical protein
MGRRSNEDPAKLSATCLPKVSGVEVSDDVVPADGFEPPTLCSEDRCSNPLSYAGTWYAWRDLNPRPLVPETNALSN